MEQKTQSKEECKICKIPEHFKDVQGPHYITYTDPLPDDCESLVFEQCGYCESMIEGDENLTHHFQNIHSSNVTYQCRRCWTLKNPQESTNTTHDKLCQMMNMCNNGFKELTDIAIISGDAVSHALNKPVADFMNFNNYIDLFVITNKSKTLYDEILKIKRKIVDILRREMRYVESDFDHVGMCWSKRKFRKNEKIDTYTFTVRGYTDHPGIKIIVVDGIYTPEELISKLCLDYQKCYYHKGNIWVSNEAQLAFDTGRTKVQGLCDMSFISEFRSLAKRMGYELIKDK